MQESSFCKECGKTINNIDKFCNHCGIELIKLNEFDPNPSLTKTYDSNHDNNPILASRLKRLIARIIDGFLGFVAIVIPFGVIAIISVLCIQIAAIIQLGDLAPIAFPIANFWGRCAPLWAINYFPHLHNKKGSGSFHKKNWQGIQEFIPALTIFLLILLSTNFNFLCGVLIKIW